VIYPFNNSNDNSSFLNDGNNRQINGMNFNNLNFGDSNTNQQIYNDYLQNHRNINEGRYSQRGQLINQNYVVNNYCN